MRKRETAIDGDRDRDSERKGDLYSDRQGESLFKREREQTERFRDLNEREREGETATEI